MTSTYSTSVNKFLTESLSYHPRSVLPLRTTRRRRRQPLISLSTPSGRSDVDERSCTQLMGGRLAERARLGEPASAQHPERVVGDEGTGFYPRGTPLSDQWANVLPTSCKTDLHPTPNKHRRYRDCRHLAALCAVHHVHSVRAGQGIWSLGTLSGWDE